MAILVAWVVAYATGPLGIASLLRYSGIPLHTAVFIVLFVGLSNALFLYFGVGGVIKWLVSKVFGRRGEACGYSLGARFARRLSTLHFVILYLIMTLPLFPYSGVIGIAALRLKELGVGKKRVILASSSFIRNVVGTWVIYSAPAWVTLPWELFQI